MPFSRSHRGILCAVYTRPPRRGSAPSDDGSCDAVNAVVPPTRGGGPHMHSRFPTPQTQVQAWRTPAVETHGECPEGAASFLQLRGAVCLGKVSAPRSRDPLLRADRVRAGGNHATSVSERHHFFRLLSTRSSPGPVTSRQRHRTSCTAKRQRREPG